MKGRISPQLQQVLRDPQGRKQLMNRLLSGRDGVITSGDQRYQVRIDVGTPVTVTPASTVKSKSG